MMDSEKFYFSNCASNDWSDCGETMQMVLIPKKWWSFKQWLLARSFMKGFHIIGMTEIKGE